MAVDTKTVYLGPPIGTDTTGQGQEGPHCAVTAAERAGRRRAAGLELVARSR